MPTLATFIQHSFGSPSRSNQIIKKKKKERKRKKWNPNWKRRSKTSSKTVLADDMILNTENPKDSSRKLLELIN